jgi:hypothetical protein
MWRFPLEVLQQFHWWMVRPGHLLRRLHRVPFLSPVLVAKACWLNSYELFELSLWWQIGVRTWTELSLHRPENLSWTVHAERRQAWPDRCQAAIRLLQDKASLLALAPPCWRSPFLVLPSAEAPPSAPSPAPTWWWAALDGPGVVLKPRRGQAGKAVIRFLRRDGALRQHPLFLRLPDSAPPFPPALSPTPDHLFPHWKRLFPRQHAALAAPCITHSTQLPPADPAVVVRVITARDRPEAPVAVLQAWLEVPLTHGPVACIHLRGTCLPQAWTPLNPAQQEAVRQWQELLQTGVPACVAACLAGAVGMHERLPPMDQVAWDWIPADPHPVLLEGNASFGQLVPRLFRRLEETGPLDPRCLAPSSDP